MAIAFSPRDATLRRASSDVGASTMSVFGSSPGAPVPRGTTVTWNIGIACPAFALPRAVTRVTVCPV